MPPEHKENDDWAACLRRQGVSEEKMETAKSGAVRMTEAADALLFDPRKAIGPDGFANLLADLGKVRS